MIRNLTNTCSFAYLGKIFLFLYVIVMRNLILLKLSIGFYSIFLQWSCIYFLALCFYQMLSKFKTPITKII